MHSNTSFLEYPSISPARSSKVRHKDNQHASINSYYDKMKESISTVQYTAQPSYDNLYDVKL